MNDDDKKYDYNNFGNDYTNFVLSSSDLTNDIKNILHSNQFAKIVKEYISQTEISISEFFDDYNFKLAENGIIEIEKQSFDMQSDDLLNIIELEFDIDKGHTISAINGIYENDYIIYYKPLNKKSNPKNEVDVYSIVELLNNKSDYIDRSNFNLLKSLIKQANNENKKRVEIELLINTQTEQTKPVEATQSPNNGIVNSYFIETNDGIYEFNPAKDKRGIGAKFARCLTKIDKLDIPSKSSMQLLSPDVFIIPEKLRKSIEASLRDDNFKGYNKATDSILLNEIIFIRDLYGL